MPKKKPDEIKYIEPTDYFPKEDRKKVFGIKKEQSITVALGDRLRKLRAEKTGLSQENFARSIKMDRTYYASIELGKRNVALINLKKIADGFEMSLSEMLEGL